MGMVIKNFSITMRAWRLNFFRSSTLHMVIERFLVAIVTWQRNLITIQWHQLNFVAIERQLCILVVTNESIGIFGHHLGTIRWQPNLLRPCDGNLFWKRVFQSI